MNKQEFLTSLRSALSGLPKADIEERIAFYGEMIDDRIEEGMSEEEAVAAIGTVDEIRKQTLKDIPLQKLVIEKVKPKRALRAWEIVLIVLGFPVWFPLLMAAGSICLSVYLVFWTLIIALWAIEISLVGAVFSAIASAAVQTVQGSGLSALMPLGAAIFIAGLTIFAFYGCIAASKGIIKLTKKIGVGIKSLFVAKEKKQ
ncbi:MAG: DUF1700 domain-containing protein [Clostridia bacterium]|nr:DUF1700 domain-containing protein [Clostridia bacterium]